MKKKKKKEKKKEHVQESKKEEVKVDKDENLIKKLNELEEKILARYTASHTDLLKFLKSTKRLIWTNFILGLSRGVGFFLGMTMVGALIVGIVFFLVREALKALNLTQVEDTAVEVVVGGMEFYEGIYDRVKDRMKEDEESEKKSNKKKNRLEKINRKD